jgi:hypothetical protein
MAVKQKLSKISYDKIHLENQTLFLADIRNVTSSRWNCQGIRRGPSRKDIAEK